MRRQPALSLLKIPTIIKEIGEILGAEKCENGRKLFFDCKKTEIHCAVLIHNIGVQFWVHYFCSEIGLVNILHFQKRRWKKISRFRIRLNSLD